MTERAQGTVGGDDCQNRAARRYEKCSYLWHYFRRFEPFFRPDPSPLPADAPRKSLSGAPFSSPRLPPPLNLLLCVPLPPRSARRTRVVLTSSPRSVPLASPSLPRSSIRPTPGQLGGPTTGAHSGAILPAPTAAGTTLMLH